MEFAPAPYPTSQWSLVATDVYGWRYRAALMRHAPKASHQAGLSALRLPRPVGKWCKVENCKRGQAHDGTGVQGQGIRLEPHLAVPTRPLLPQPEKGIGEVRLDGNLIVQGDNLHALKALLPMYAGKVDCIFIDPPYNTDNEGWANNDNVNAPMIKEWLEANPIGIEDGLRHDKWCAMMWPRLRLLHELLAEWGSIWITLDDNEAH